MFGRRSAGDLFSLEKRATPPPISVLPSGNFIGNDGNWSSFAIRVGTPAQNTDVLISTLSTELWAIGDFACSNGGNSDPSCATSRGGPDGLFASQNSNTWNYTQTISFAIDSQLIPQSSNDAFGGNYGYDTLGLFTQQTNAGNPSSTVLTNQVLATVADRNIWNGLLGISPRMPNFAPNNTQGSYLTNLFNQSKIPSLSYSYTAGAYYRGKTNASLTLGGFDTTRFNDPGLYLQMNQDKFHDLVVGLQSIQYTPQGGKQQTLMSDGILAMVDSTVTPMWLPQSACDAFANAFGLTQDSLTQLYVLNDTMHDNNVKNNATVDLMIGSNISGGQTTKISFPYAAFDWNFTNPTSTQGPKRYFPIRVAGSSNLYTLGRTFLQEAVLTADYGRGNFTIAQALPVTSSTKANIVPITNSTGNSGSGSGNSPTNPGSGNGGNSNPSGQFADQSDGGLTGGAKAGIAVGVIVGVAAIALALFFWLRRRKSKKAAAEPIGQKEMNGDGGMQQTQSPPPQYNSNTPNDYFGSKSPNVNTPHQVAKSPAVTPGINEPGPATQPWQAHEMSAAQEATRNAAVLNDPLGWQRYDNSSLHPGSAATTPGVGGHAGAAAMAAAGGAGTAFAAHELSGSEPRDMPHEMSSPNVPHEMPSPDPHAAELMSPTTPAPPTPSSGRVSPLPASAVTPTVPPTTSLPAALAPAPLSAASEAPSKASTSMHHSQRSSTTLPDAMQPTMHDPMPANAAQNVTAAELASNRTTWFSDTDGVSPDPEAQNEGYFSGTEGGISRNTSVASAVAQPVTAGRGRIVTHARSPSTDIGGIERIAEEGPSEHHDVTPP